jgi:uncharacterized protein (UPF0305 family)
MNAIIEKLNEARNGNYCHCLEVENVSELESNFQSIVDEFQDDFTTEEIQDFINTLSIYYLGDDETEENEVYNYKFNV